jgi:hypothetical protein
MAERKFEPALEGPELVPAQHLDVKKAFGHIDSCHSFF